MYICICTFTCVCVRVCIHVCMYVYVYVYMHTYICVCMYACVCVHAYVYMCMYIYKSICISAESLHAFTGDVEHHACAGVYVRQMLWASAYTFASRSLQDVHMRYICACLYAYMYV